MCVTSYCGKEINMKVPMLKMVLNNCLSSLVFEPGEGVYMLKTCVSCMRVKKQLIQFFDSVKEVP